MALAPPPPDAEAAILGPETDVIRYIEIYEEDGATPFMIDGSVLDAGLVGGNITISYSRDERRAFDLTLDNSEGELAHYPGGFWYDKIIKVFRGVSYDDALTGEELEWVAQTGEFMIDTIESQNFPHTIQVTGRDYTKKLLVSKFKQATSFATGLYVVDVIKTIAQNGGISKFIFPTTVAENAQLGRVFMFERGTQRWKAMKDIAQAYGFELFFDAQGYLVMRRFIDPSSAPQTYTFKTGQYGNLVSFRKRTSDARIYNVVIVTGQAADQSTVYAIAENRNNDSPTSIDNLGSERVFEYQSSFISTTAQAQMVADSFLQVHALEEFDINMESIVIPWLEVGEVVEFLDPDPNPGDPTKFFLTDMTLPISLGPMGSVAKRVLVVG